MKSFRLKTLAACCAVAVCQIAVAGTEPFFVPLTETATVTEINSYEELNSPWVAPEGVTQTNLTSLWEAESDPSQSIIRVESLGNNGSMFDMSSFDNIGRFVFIPHETQYGAGLSRYDIKKDEVTVLFRGDEGGATGDWSNDFGALDPATWTPRNTLLLGEEWSGQGRLFEVLNPKAAPKAIRVRELHNVPNVSHEGLRFSNDGKTLYFVDEYASGSIYKIVFGNKGNYSRGQVFILSVSGFAGDADASYGFDEGDRTGAAVWIPMTDAAGTALTSIDPFSNDGCFRCGRDAADELGGTPFNRPEDVEVGRLANGNEVLYFAATGENAVYSVEMTGADTANVRVFASELYTPKNLGFDPTDARLNSPDNLAQDAMGNIYIIEDAPNGGDGGRDGDVWFARDVDNDGMAESIDHFLSNRVNGSEATGMIFNPANPAQFIISVQHPRSTTAVDGQGDALWLFDVSSAATPE